MEEKNTAEEESSDTFLVPLPTSPLFRSSLRSLVPLCDKNAQRNEKFGDIEKTCSISAVGFMRNNMEFCQQNGPQCGLVALKMAATGFGIDNISVEQIFRKARECGYTSNGEIFSGIWMSDLVSKVLNVQVTELENKQEDQTAIVVKMLSSLLKSNFILIPYDTDKNNEPCNNNGQTAHWAIIFGFVTTTSTIFSEQQNNMDAAATNTTTTTTLVVPPLLTTNTNDGITTTSSSLVGPLFQCQNDPEIEGLTWIAAAVKNRNNSLSSSFKSNNNEEVDNFAKKLVADHAEDGVYFIAAHGKSKHPGLWNAKVLLNSNAQLNEFSCKRQADGLTYILPENGVEELKNKILLLHKPI